MKIRVVLDIDYEGHAHLRDAEATLMDYLGRVMRSQIAPLVQYPKVGSNCTLVGMTVDPLSTEELDALYARAGLDQEKRSLLANLHAIGQSRKGQQ